MDRSRFGCGVEWAPDGSALIMQAVTFSGNPEVGGDVVDQGLYAVGLDGTGTRLREGADRWQITVGNGWVLESGHESHAALWVWRGSPPPLPAEPLADQRVGLPNGDLAAMTAGGTVWSCSPGAPECRELGRLANGYGLTVAGPWLVLQWEAGSGGFFVGGVRWR